MVPNMREAQSVNLPTDELMHTPLFSWIVEEGLEMFSNCFDMEAEEIPAGECRDSRGRVGYLLSGAALVNDGPPAGDGVFGVRLLENGTFSMEEAAIRAERPCVVVWMNPEILTSVCYRACWFHGRLILEMRKLLSARQG